MDTDYTKRELDMKFESIEQKMDDNHAEIIEKVENNETKNLDRALEIFNMLKEIKADTTKHNGRLSAQEATSQSMLLAGKVVIALGSVIVGLVIYIYQYQLSQQATRITNLKTTVETLQANVQNK